MIDINHAQELIGSEVYDPKGDKIGKVGSVYVNDETRKPEWVTVRTGLFGTKETFVPLSGAAATDQGVRVPVTRDKVKDAPQVGAEGGHMSEQEGRDLYQYYGLSPAARRTDPGQSQPSVQRGMADTAAGTGQDAGARPGGAPDAGTGRRAAAPGDTGTTVSGAGGGAATAAAAGTAGAGAAGMAARPRAAESSTGTGTPARPGEYGGPARPGTPQHAADTPGAESQRESMASGHGSAPLGTAAQGITSPAPGTARTPSGTTEPEPTPSVPRQARPSELQSMTRSEERLKVGTERVESGHVRLRKYVVTEEEQIRISLSHEEVRIERRPIAESERAGAMRDATFGEQSHEIVLHAERPVVTKETVPMETVQLRTETVTNEQIVKGEVRKERIDVEDGTQHQGAEQSGSQQSGAQQSGSQQSGTQHSGTPLSGAQPTETQQPGTQHSGSRQGGGPHAGTQYSAGQQTSGQYGPSTPQSSPHGH